MKANFMTTAIGSMPYDDAAHAVDVSLKSMDVPIWPQMSRFGLLEQMEVQYSEGIPCITIDFEKSRAYFKTDQDYSEAFAEFYENYMIAADPDEGNGDFSFMAISPENSRGIHALLDALKAKGGKLPWLKVQTCGPASFALTVVNEIKRAIYYDEEFRDVIVKALAAKCRWQIQQFKPYAENIICFIDEPILCAFGSSTYVSVKREDIVDILNEVITEIKAEGAISGIHCCGNTEWSIPIDAGVDIVNFDAFEFGHTVAMYPEHVKAHLEKGGMLAWGIIPTSKAVQEQTVETLEQKFEEVMDLLASKGIDKSLIVSQAIITPACGTGSMDLEDADRVFELLPKFAEHMKAKYNL
jgi:hypothetical protein